MRGDIRNIEKVRSSIATRARSAHDAVPVVSREQRSDDSRQRLHRDGGLATARVLQRRGRATRPYVLRRAPPGQRRGEAATRWTAAWRGSFALEPPLDSRPPAAASRRFTPPRPLAPLCFRRQSALHSAPGNRRFELPTAIVALTRRRQSSLRPADGTRRVNPPAANVALSRRRQSSP